ncbi:MAG: hypothetical protein ABR552_10370 [Actinomycetota bacterium]|nr:hypothetical protein [Actinomycetota bacterium]
MRRIPVFVACLAFIAGSHVPARALPTGEGCIAAGAHSWLGPLDPPWGCHFVATGPTYFVAATPNPFVIYVDNGHGKVILVQRSEAMTKNPGQTSSAGGLDTHMNDHVFVSVSPWDYTQNQPCNSFVISACGRDGAVSVSSQF